MISPALMSVLIPNGEELLSFTYDSSHTSQMGPQGDRVVEAPRLRSFDNWTCLELVMLEKQKGTQEKWSLSQAYGIRLSANMENDEDSLIFLFFIY